MITDIHTHIDLEDEEVFSIYRENNIRAIVCATEPDEAKKLIIGTDKMDNVLVSVGIHPWKSDLFNFSDIEKQLDQSSIVGEIGMDSVWCEINMDIQREIFEIQLDYAQKTHKPVILHTKGQEKIISEILSLYTMKKMVHWYSCDKYLDKYIEQNCYFSVGPSVHLSENVANVCRQVDINRLFVETDGYESMKWIDKDLKKSDIPKVLLNSIEFISREKEYSVEETMKILENNYNEFISNNY